MPKERREKIDKLQKNIERVIKGKPEVVKKAIIAILAQGHLLIEDVPGVGKTTLAHLLAASISCTFQRIQFTSDLLPSDILGVSIYDPKRSEFEFKKGPIFANIVLADEINRTTPKTQSALLEAMNTSRVSIDKITYQLPMPFMVIATQNPVEFHGTFPLPKAQLDRFLMRIHIGYPDLADEIIILKEQTALGSLDQTEHVLAAEDVLAMQREVEEVKVDEDLLEYVGRIAAATRNSPHIELGVSTRGALALRRAAQAKAYYENRDYCIPDDIKVMIEPTLAHRIQVAKSFESGSIGGHREDEEILRQVVSDVEVPL
ncbi:MAG TPA: MoxR family ATPase [Candidatus Sumerlaeota bacterium]|nr:MAG: ATPase RavA [candidate division BRC1 bacterium ADurb.Bin183]HOE62710.1 MoxR family ATPase [Candidatus Sumerlaeota bacterium]HRR32191.1 MoxR family ATPase [Candidatus Sumerlaeia bacterium]HON50430.1 MoxR family ATPase [Candidatus Sumerlaeota bacterium]HOR63646.1 MoxR family ATPase [Candidatus Sumerlaeota bacterium]